MTGSNIRQQLLDHIEALPGEEVKTILLQWLIIPSSNLEDFEKLLTNQSNQITEESFDYGEIDSGLNFQPLTEEEMVQQSILALEAYRRNGSSVDHNRVREWADSLTLLRYY
ncbi:MAG: hypothetical protein F6J94_19620 [Moorea sp. SIO1F2]|uniref:hypothetical protein n=1 Tax=unclassified Moorena TaxID=2683338 RepID=UPI0013BBC865|nr:MULTISPECIES: hypothetical protein [unclassified Moorena]NEO19486.1 hypothetical protein [Moorena sp. SIO4A5]NEP21936.1 hypothetical protein [Moorena sp. SIO3I6]NEQ62137.1 hypothetical protein [Moorena sp. SIO4A1]NET84045.1 hypothetical protein [Moorena sp. SIO1F2]